MSRRWFSFLGRGIALSALLMGLGLSAVATDVSAKKRESAQTASKSKKKAAATRRSTAAPEARGRGVRKPVMVTRVINGRRVKVAVKAVALTPAVPSVGQQAGLHAVGDPLDLKSGVALVVDPDSNEVLLSKNPGAVLPIASITKLMTALVVIESRQPLDEMLTIEQDDLEQTSNSRSRLVSGTTMSRADMMRLALMSSENRAAHALSRHYPGGREAFVAAMNAKAQQLGMHDTRFVESTGLSADNRSSAMDLVRLVGAASSHDVIREFSTAKESTVAVGDERLVQFRSTNGLIGNPEWDISLQKTGYIAAAGRCLVMQAQLAGRRLIMVLLDSTGKYSRFGDAERIRKWLATDGRAIATLSNPTAPTVTR